MELNPYSQTFSQEMIPILKNCNYTQLYKRLNVLENLKLSFHFFPYTSDPFIYSIHQILFECRLCAKAVYFREQGPTKQARTLYEFHILRFMGTVYPKCIIFSAPPTIPLLSTQATIISLFTYLNNYILGLLRLLISILHRVKLSF